jgi:deoxycytidylate deaminase
MKLPQYYYDPRLLESFDWSYVYRNCNDPVRKVGAILHLSSHEEFYGTNHILWDRKMQHDEWFWKMNRDIARSLVTHAEAHAIFQAIDAGITNFAGSVLISTLEPCVRCRELIQSVGIPDVFFGEVYEQSGR